MMDHLTPGFGPLELELLEPKDQELARSHLVDCSPCAAEYRISAEALASLAMTLPRTNPSPQVRERLLKSLAQTNRFDMFVERVAALIDVGIDKAREILARIDVATTWSNTAVPGIFSYDPPHGPAVADAVVGWVRVQPGVEFPHHEHMGDEAMLVIQGSCIDSYGTVMRRGELARLAPGTAHTFKALPGPDFIYLGVAKNGIVMFGVHMKPGDPRA
jgi:putative transcriptional regulator